MLRLVLIDDHVAFREALAFVMTREPDWEVVGQVGSLNQSRRILAKTPFDVVVLDLGLPDGNGIDLVPEIRQLNSSSAILVLTGNESPGAYVKAVKAGVSAFCSKTVGVEEIVNTVRRLSEGETVLESAEVIQMAWEANHDLERDREAQERLSQLTRREREVLEALATGLADRQIAQRLSISHETVRSHMANLCGKLGVQSRLQAVLFAVSRGAIGIDQVTHSSESIEFDS